MLGNALPSLTPQQVPDVICSTIARAVLSGRLKAGERLRQAKVAEQLGVSQASVRHAFAQLERYGLVVTRPRKGVLVRAWTKDDLIELCTLRELLEGLAARLAATRLTTEAVGSLSQRVAEMRAALERTDYEALTESDLALHAEIWALAGHVRLKQVLQDMILQIRLFMILTRPLDLPDYADQHQLLLDALRSGDPETAEQEARKHVMRTVERMNDPDFARSLQP
jgi:DNA-binding GntR family transcriptional regulator